MPSFSPVAFVINDHLPPFEALDHWINDPSTRPAFLAGLVAHEKQGFSAGGPFVGDDDTQQHWSSDWVDAAGHGGAYWPYLTDIDIGQKLADGLTRSVQIVADNPEKSHNTIWLSRGDRPAADLSADEQQALFEVNVFNTATAVILVILTPNPELPI
jgi:hypothetical protein